MNICYYVSSHGYGHGVRTCAICNEFSPEVNIFFRTALPESFLSEELRRPFTLISTTADCGCIQTDSITVDIGATAETYRRIERDNKAMLERDAAWCEEQKIDIIVSDIVPFAFDIAHTAGICSCAVTNFTWYDIYREYASVLPEFVSLSETIRKQYMRADLLIAADPALPMPYFSRRVDVPVIGREGRGIRDQVCRFYGFGKEKKIALIYIGNFGMNRADWKRLERYGDWEFLGLYPPDSMPRNFHCIDKKVFPCQNISASVDCIISKLGYSTVAECLINGVPLVYVPRSNFAEYSVLENAVVTWGHGYRLETEEYFSIRWDAALSAACSRPRPSPRKTNGARLCAAEIEKLCRGRRGIK